MHYSAAIATLFTASMAPITLASLSAEDIKEAVGNGCRNHIDFKGRFRTEDGSSCGSCALCKGSAVSSLFVPQAKDTCIQCTKAEESCAVFEVIASFENAWIMKHATLTPSALAPASDPKKVTTSGSNDLLTWEVLHSNELNFSDREQKEQFSFSNEKKYKHYSISFQISEDVMNVGKYGLVEAYTRGCTSELHAGITGDLVPAYSTSSPTSAPTKSGHTFNAKADLQPAVNLWVSNEKAALNKYGHIRDWRTERIRDMSSLFKSKVSFNEDISSWNTSSVTSMYVMFYFADSFNINLSNWNVKKVQWMEHMFEEAPKFNQRLCWDVSGAQTGNMMFYKSLGGLDTNYPDC